MITPGRAPFFTLVTRTFPGRLDYLERCRRSVAAQTFRSLEHLVLRDPIGAGVAKAQLMMHTARPKGEYVIVLDDDDYLQDATTLEKLHTAIRALPALPCFAVVRAQHDELGPMPKSWGEPPLLGTITVSNVVVENVQWYAHRRAFGQHYAGDYDFIASLFAAHEPAWIDLEVVHIEARHMGAPA